MLKAAAAAASSVAAAVAATRYARGHAAPSPAPVALIHDGRAVAVCADARRYSVSRRWGAPPAVWSDRHGKKHTCVAPGDAATTVVFGMNDGRMKFVDVDSGASLAVGALGQGAPVARVWCVALTEYACALEDGTVRYWNFEVPTRTTQLGEVPVDVRRRRDDSGPYLEMTLANGRTAQMRL